MEEKENHNIIDQKRSVRLPPSPPRASRTLYARDLNRTPPSNSDSAGAVDVAEVPADDEPPALTRGTIHRPRGSILPTSINPADDGTLGCCGFRCNPRLISFFTKTSIAVLIMGFCFIKLWYDNGCECSDDSAVYVSMLSSVLSFFIGHSIRQ